MLVPSPNWRLRGEHYPMIRVSLNSPATFCGGAAVEEGLHNLQRAVELDPATATSTAALSYRTWRLLRRRCWIGR